MTASQNGEEFKLEILKLELKDAGVYECILTNPVGSVTQRAVLEVTREFPFFIVVKVLKVYLQPSLSYAGPNLRKGSKTKPS